MDKTIRLSLTDLLFINYVVEPDRLRPFIPAELELDTLTDDAGRAVALLSAVAFRVADIRSGVLPLPGLSFNQINYRAYVKIEGPAVYFFDMRVNARAVSSLSSLLRIPVSYENIDINVESVLPNIGTSEVDVAHENPSPNSLRYSLVSHGPHGLEASVLIGGPHAVAGPSELAVRTSYITERPIGYATVAGDSLYKITADHEPLDALASHVENVRAPALSSLGIMNLDETTRPHSALYVREAVFDTKVPRPISQE